MKGLLFTYLFTGGGALAGLFRPFYAFLAYVVFAIIKPELMWPWAVPQGRYSLLIALGMLLGWAMTRRVTLNLGQSFGVAALLMAFLGWAWIDAFLPGNQVLAWDYVDRLAKIAIPWVIGLTCITSSHELKQLAWTIVGAQGYVAYELNSYYFGGFNVLRDAGFGGMDNNSAAIALVTGIGIAFFLGLHATSLWEKWLAFLLAALMGHAILFSFSRGGMLGMVVSGIATFAVIPKRPRTYAALIAALAMTSILAGAEVRERFMSTFVKDGDEREASAQSRVDLWKDCWDVMKKNPVFGCGPNHWPVIASNYGWPDGKEAHSLWMQTGAEMGFPGLAFYLSFYLLCIFRLWVLTWKRTHVEDPWHRYTARMALVGLCGFVVSAQFVSIESLEIPYYTALLGCGALKLARSWKSIETEEIQEVAVTSPHGRMWGQGLVTGA